MLPFAASHGGPSSCTSSSPPSWRRRGVASDSTGNSRLCTGAVLDTVQNILLGAPALCEAQAPGEQVLPPAVYGRSLLLQRATAKDGHEAVLPPLWHVSGAKTCLRSKLFVLAHPASVSWSRNATQR